jgi:cobalt-zinc-cadmium efflux system membrane fusion protein
MTQSSDSTNKERKSAVISEDHENVTATVVRGGRSKLFRTTLALGVLVAVIIAGVAGWLLYTKSRSGAGRPVPAPRIVAETGTNSTDSASQSTEATLSLSPEAISRAGIKIEPVGEQNLGTAGDQGAASTGVVQANAYRTTPVMSLVGGIVRQVGAELGQQVRRGQMVAVVSSEELAMAQSKYLSATADLDEHERHHKRTIELVEIGAASREELEQANSKMKTAESEVGSLRQRLMLLGIPSDRVAALKSSSQISSEVSLPSPAAGTVIGRSVNPGEVIEANKEILRVADLSSIWVVAQVFEKDLASVRIGSGASITSVAIPGRVFRGRVSYVDPSLDPATRTAQVRIELSNPRQIFKIGMYVNVAFATIGGAESTAPTVPAAAVQNINNQQVVFVATSDPNIFAMRPVHLGPESNGRYTVIEGLHAGDRIVTDGSFSLRAEWLKLHPGGS